jgi:hypothetical protein
MTPALLLAVLAGVAASGAVVDLAAVAGSRAGGRGGPGPGRRAVLALVALGRRAGLPLRPPADLAARLAAAGTGDGGREGPAAADGGTVGARDPERAAAGRPTAPPPSAFTGARAGSAFAAADPLADLMALKTGAALVAGLLAVPAAGAAPGGCGSSSVPGPPGGPTSWPDLWLARRGGAGRRRPRRRGP